ncbi:MAG: DUF2920 family protein [Lentisphaerae bacterium]|nr:DUF2920 family protein [Lentisphaerota bacterium]MCP4101893.1 DUF2920 family protein [Lentisphaerota bacterium]
MDERFKEIEVESSIDGVIEKNLLYLPENSENTPMVIGLHTWSHDRFNQMGIIKYCETRGWALLLPEFRGSNTENNPRAPKACGSLLARQDIIDAVEHVCGNYSIDKSKLFVLGGSGGGHMSLMMAAFRPTLWRGVSSWCPITDVALWHRYYGRGIRYAANMEACCGGAPGDSDDIDREYALRSPMSYTSAISQAAVSVHHGRYDRSVPYVHTLNLAAAVERLHPENFFCEIFDGAHEMRAERAFEWFEQLLSSDDKKELTG